MQISPTRKKKPIFQTDEKVEIEFPDFTKTILLPPILQFYHLPTPASSHIGISKIRIFFSVHKLFNFIICFLSIQFICRESVCMDSQVFMGKESKSQHNFDEERKEEKTDNNKIIKSRETTQTFPFLHKNL